MSWVAIGVGVVGAAGSYLSSKQQNKTAKAAGKGTSSSTSTQTPYMWENVNPGLETLLADQRDLYNRGPAYIGGKGTMPTYGDSAAAPPQAGMPGGAKAAPPAGMRYNKAGKLVGPKKGGGAAPGPGAPAGPNLGTASGIASEVARRGLEAGTDPTSEAAKLGVRNILSGQGGADSGGTGYQGYNPISDALAQRLLGESNDGDELLRQFIGSVSGTSGAPGGGGRPGNYASSSMASRQAQSGVPVTGGGGAYGQGGYDGSPDPNIVPDTVGQSSDYFAQQIRDMMDQGANDADLQAVIDAANADTLRTQQKSMWDLDAAAQGSGRFGGDMWKALGNESRGQAAREMSTTASRTRLDELGNRRAMQQALLGQVNARDLGAMGDLTNREAIRAGERNAALSANAASAGAGAAAEAQARQQQLQAIGMLMQGQQFNTSQLGDLGAQLSSNQLGAIGEAPGLAGIGLSGLGIANQSGGILADIQNAKLAASTQRGIANAGLNQQAQMYNAAAGQNSINDYMNLLRSVGGMGGTATQSGGSAGGGGASVNPIAAGLLGGVSGYLGSGGTFGGGGGGSTAQVGAPRGWSDRRLKDNIRTLAYVDGIRVVEWTWRDVGGVSRGVVADEVAHIPGVVARDPVTGYDVVDYSRLPAAVRAIREA